MPMHDNHIDKLYKSRFRNHESDIPVHEDELWNSIAKNSKKGSMFYKSKWFYLATGIVSGVIAYVLFMPKNQELPKKIDTVKVEEHISIPVNANTQKSEILKENNCIENKIKPKNITEKISDAKADKTEDLHVSNNQTVVHDLEPEKTNIVEEPKPVTIQNIPTDSVNKNTQPQVVKRIKVVKQQIIQKDTITTTKRRRKY